MSTRGRFFLRSLMALGVAGVVAASADAQGRVAAQVARAKALEKKSPAQAVAMYKEILRATPSTPEALNNLAWLQATSSDPKIYNPSEAVRNAANLVGLTHYKERSTIGPWSKAFRIQNIYVLTVAFVAAGNQEQATVHAQQMLELATRYHQRTGSPESEKILGAAKTVHTAVLNTGPGAIQALSGLDNEESMACEVSEVIVAAGAGSWEQHVIRATTPLKVNTEFPQLDVAPRV